MLIAITIVQLLAALVLILIVLFQSGKSKGLSGAIGGVATSGIMSHWTGRQEGGCFAELREKARDCESEQVIKPEKLRILMLDMLYKAGVDGQLYTAFSDCLL